MRPHEIVKISPEQHHTRTFDKNDYSCLYKQNIQKAGREKRCKRARKWRETTAATASLAAAATFTTTITTATAASITRYMITLS